MPTNKPRFSMNGNGNLEDRNRKAAATLAPLFDLLNSGWMMAEEHLKKNRENTTSVVIDYRSEPSDPYRPDEYQNHYCLAFLRHKGDWRICWGMYGDGGYPEPTHWLPIVEAPDEEKLAAQDHFLELEEEVVKKAEDFVPKLRSAVDKWKRFFGEM